MCLIIILSHMIKFFLLSPLKMAARNILTAPCGNSPGVRKCREGPEVTAKYEYVPQRLTSEVHGNRRKIEI